MVNWILTSQQMPPDEVFVLFWYGRLGFGERNARKYESRPWTDLTDVDMCGDPNHLRDSEVTHWMLAPGAP